MEEKLSNPESLPAACQATKAGCCLWDMSNSGSTAKAVGKLRLVSNALLMFYFSGGTKKHIQRLEGKYTLLTENPLSCPELGLLLALLSMCRI